jgi:hypothetical protein
MDELQMMSGRFYSVLLASMVLLSVAGCANDEKLLAEACMKQIISKGNGDLTITADDLVNGVSKLADGTYEVKGNAIYAAGTNNEKTWPVLCALTLKDGTAEIVRSEIYSF